MEVNLELGKGLIQNRLTEDGSVTGATVFEGWLRKIIITGDSSNVAEIIVYDNSGGASGTVICRYVAAASAADKTVSTPVDFPGAGVKFAYGMYLDMSGGTTAVQVYWDQ